MSGPRRGPPGGRRPRALDVLAAMARRADPHGFVRTSSAAIGRELGVGRDYARAVMRRLARLGLLEPPRGPQPGARHDASGAHRPQVWRVAVERLGEPPPPASAPPPPARAGHGAP